MNTDHHTNKLKALLEVYQLSQLITETTHVTMNSSTLIDHFITNYPEKICKSGVIHTGISDHSLIFAIRKINAINQHKNKEKIVELRNMKHFDEQKFLNDLANQTWEDVYFFPDNPDDMWDIWKNLFLEILYKHAPIKRTKVKVNH